MDYLNPVKSVMCGTLLCVILQHLWLKLGRKVFLFMIPPDVLRASGSSHGNDQDIYANAKRKLDYYGGQVDFSGKNLLDVGCGIGKKTMSFSTMSSEIVAVDVVKRFIRKGHDFARDRDLVAPPNFVVADSAHLPLREDIFQVVISNDLMEHVSNCARTILEMERVTAPKGCICIDFGPPWRSPFGAHLDTLGDLDWFLAPWLHIIFSEENIKGMLVAFGKMKESDRHLSLFIRFLNKMSIAEFETILKGTKLKISYLKLLTPSPLQILSRTVLREYVTYRVVAFLQKRVEQNA